VSAPADVTLESIAARAARAGLALRGALHPPAELLPPVAAAHPVGTLVLLGFTGGLQWPVFSASAEAGDGRPHPLDRWSRRTIGALASEVGATALYPNDGPPWLPFQRWARAAEPVHPSPLGVLIHPDFGLWHAYRGALAFSARLTLPARDARPSPCERCTGKPCLTTCPIGAVTAEAFDTTACDRFVRASADNDCRLRGCAARARCPVGAAYRYGEAQARFHMAAFIGR
jgi:hypothetical protein